MTADRGALRDRIAALVDRLADGARDDAARDALLVALARHQLAHLAPWRRLVEARGVDLARVRGPQDIPAVPTEVFRHARLAVHPPAEDRRVFRTSGTTGTGRGQRFVRDLSMYDRAARAAAKHALFPDAARLRLIVLAPTEQEAPDSSLAYMIARFAEWFAAGDVRWVWRDGRLELDALERALRGAEADDAPVGLLGTSFAFVHAEDGLAARNVRFALPAGSRIMHTGGFKGRSRVVAPDALRARLAARYGVPSGRVVVEYGMTELSSQMYDLVLREDAPRHRALWMPGWVRATPVHPETLAPVPEGDVGILRIDDLANLDTPCSIQTADLARRAGSRIEVLGRAPGAAPRGCSLAVDAVLGGAP